MKRFVDTSFFIAILSKHDQWHRKALQVAKTADDYVTSSLVINETISLLQGRGLFSQALIFLRNARSNKNLEIVYPDPVLQAYSWDQCGKWGATGANAVDCVSFAIMQRRAIRDALTFDRHFELAGFRAIPR